MRYQSARLVVENLEAHVAAGYRRFFFVDNVFNLPATYAESICDEDLLQPTFYLEPDLDRWLQETEA